ncbi:MAG: patatin-like phospholipase family protein [Gaiellaceae bacterium]
MAAPESGAIRRAASPVNDVRRAAAPEPTEGVALCLSGGGYRAMLFHAGALARLNELGWLPKLDRVSSVSGGSITAGVLALAWEDLQFEDGTAANLRELVIDPLHSLAGKTVDVRAIVLRALGPGSIGMGVAAAYRRHLFKRATLQDLPQRPRFVFNATSLQSGVLRRFSKPYAWDYRVGKIPDPQIEVAVAVAASSAFPPVLSPLVLRVAPDAHVPGTGDDNDGDEPNLESPPYTTRLVLTDGGVYDNLGLETAWHGHRTILISDGGGRLGPKQRPRAFWPLQLFRVLSVVDSQVRSLRKRQAIDAFKGGLRAGVYWGIRTNIAHYEVADALPAPRTQTIELAQIKTRLGRMSRVRQERLVNWGYAVCDAGMRAHVIDGEAPPPTFPYPEAGVG